MQLSKDGSKGAFGYGLLTAKNGIVQSAGVTQNNNPNNPVRHNHFASLIVTLGRSIT
ncbi:MAG: hypothetical protein WA941_18930 [Nitrososphaeraceae archaeon]